MIPFGFGVMLSKVVTVVWKFSDSNPELPSSEIKVGEILISDVLSVMIPQANLVPALPDVVAGSKVSSFAWITKVRPIKVFCPNSDDPAGISI